MAISKVEKSKTKLFNDLKGLKKIMDGRTYAAYEMEIIKTRGLKRLDKLSEEIKSYSEVKADGKITKKSMEELKKNKEKEEFNKIDTLSLKKIEEDLKKRSFGSRIDSVIYLKKYLEKYIGQDISIYWYIGDKLKQFVRYDIPNNYSSWFNKTAFLDWIKDSDENLFETNDFKGVLYFVKNSELKLTPKKIRQYFKDGVSNCLLTPIKNWIDTRLEEVKQHASKKEYRKRQELIEYYLEKYVNGVPENDLADIANKLQIDINVDLPFGNIHYIQCKSTKKPLTRFSFINTRLNHVDFNKIVSEDNKIYLTKEELLEKEKELKNEFYLYSLNKNGLTKITTMDAVYSIKSDFRDCVNKFEIDSGLINCKIDDIKNNEVSLFVRSGVHYNGCSNFNNILEGELKNIDMEKAYFHFFKSKFYNGFLGKITDYRATDKREGIGMYRIYDLDFSECDKKFKFYNDSMKMYVNYNIYPSCDLDLLDSYGVKYKINLGCWGSPIDFRFPQEFLQREKDDKGGKGISYFSKYVGSCNSRNLRNSFFMKGSQEFAENLLNSVPDDVNIFWKGGNIFWNDGNIMCDIPKKSNFHLSHITAFITAYQRLNLIEQLMAMDNEKILRVKTDGIYFVEHLFDLKNVFRYEEKSEEKMLKQIYSAGDEFFLSGIDLTEEDIFVYGDVREDYKKELFIGAGGNGKTHYNLMDVGLINPAFVAPSWKLARRKHEEYGVFSTVWARIISNDIEKINYIKRFCNVLIIDEVSMMTQEQKNFIFKNFSDLKLIFMGDLGYQLGPYMDDGIGLDGFDNIREFTVNYRCQCNVLRKLLDDIRGYIREGIDMKVMNILVNNELKRLGRFINMEDFKKQYEVDDMVLSGVNVHCDYITETFRGKFQREKYFVRENNRKFNNGEIVIGEKPEAECVVKHCFSVHSIQGETAEKKLFIDSSALFENRMYYTALSRARYLSQIYIFTPDEDMKNWVKIEKEKKSKK